MQLDLIIHRSSFKIDQIICHKACLNRYKKIEIALASFQITIDKFGLQQQEKKQKAYKFMETEKYSTEWYLGQDRNVEKK